MKVSLFVTCLVDQFFPEVGEAAVKVLRHLGAEVDFPPGQTCCGQPAFNTGYRTEALRVARGFLKAFRGSDYIVAPSGSCVSMVRAFYPHLFKETPYEEEARHVAGRTYEFSHFLAQVLRVTEMGARLPQPLKVTFHDACHALRELGIAWEPRSLLRSVKGLELVESDGHEACCGFGGTFSFKYPQISMAILQDKVNGIKKSGAQVVTALDSSCLMHIAGAFSRQGVPVRAVHLATLLAQGLGE